MPPNLNVVADRFRLLGPIGKGNMGEVHRAVDEQAAEGDKDRVVAVKLILRSRSGAPIDTSADNKAVQRFEREVRIMRKLTHPNLPRTIDGGVDDNGLPYLAMEFLDGRRLARPVRRARRSCRSPGSRRSARRSRTACRPRTPRDVIHRDLKPSNVMLLRGGTVKVLDFGMGRIVDDPDGTQLTSTGVTVGTARYMAPEQFHRRRRRLRPPTCTRSAACCSSCSPACRRSQRRPPARARAEAPQRAAAPAGPAAPGRPTGAGPARRASAGEGSGRPARRRGRRPGRPPPACAWATTRSPGWEDFDPVAALRRRPRPAPEPDHRAGARQPGGRRPAWTSSACTASSSRTTGPSPRAAR